MSSPVCVVVANLYMEFFEELALKLAPSRFRWCMEAVYSDIKFTVCLPCHIRIKEVE